jgi:hypothetical protein
MAIICGIFYTILIYRLDFTVRGLIYFIPGLLASILIFLLYRNKKIYKETLIMHTAHEKLFQVFFVIVFILSILALYYSDYRPWYYFVLITGLYCVIFLQIFNGGIIKPGLILFEISCAMGNIAFGLHLKYPFYFGLSDIIPHLYLSQITLLSGHIIPPDLDYSYAWFPLFHIFIAEGTNLMGIDIKTVFILLTTLVFIVSIWILYLLFIKIIKKPQTALLVCLIYSTTPVVILYSSYVVTRVMAFIGFILLLYVVHQQTQTSKWRSFSLLALLFSLFIILVHQVSLLQILLLLGVLFIVELVVNDFFTIKTKILAFILITSSTYWIFTSFFFTSVVMAAADSASVSQLSQVMPHIQPGNGIIFLQENIITALIIFFVMVGIGYLCYAYQSKYPSVIGLFVLVTFPLYFPSPLKASAFAMLILRIDRISLLLSPFVAFAFAVGFLLVLNILHQNKYTGKIALCLGVLIFSVLCFSALTVENASDSPDVSSHLRREYFTEPELNSFAFVPHYIPYNSTIRSDEYAIRMFEKYFFSETKTLNLPWYKSSSTFNSSDTFTFGKGFFILRQQELNQHGLRFESTSMDYAETLEPAQENLIKFSDMITSSPKIYDNQKVCILANFG